MARRKLRTLRSARRPAQQFCCEVGVGRTPLSGSDAVHSVGKLKVVGIRFDPRS